MPDEEFRANVWVASPDDRPILDEIEKQTDRGAALIATSYLEERLYNALLARLIRNKDAEGALFGRSRPLSSFSSRIDLGALIGIYGPETRKILHTIREIRNEFAHKPQPRDFNFQKIHALCNNIRIDTRVTINRRDVPEKHALAFKGDGTPKGEFLNAIRYLLLLLDMETKKMPLRVPAPPVFPSPLLKAAKS